MPRDLCSRSKANAWTGSYRWGKDISGGPSWSTSPTTTGNVLLRGSPEPAHENGRVQRRERLGGLLNFYHRTAAWSGLDQILGQDGDTGGAGKARGGFMR